MCWHEISMTPAQDDTHKSVHVGLSHLAPTSQDKRSPCICHLTASWQFHNLKTLARSTPSAWTVNYSSPPITKTPLQPNGKRGDVFLFFEDIGSQNNYVKEKLHNNVWWRPLRRMDTSLVGKQVGHQPCQTSFHPCWRNCFLLILRS